jgi:Raf kinase inhibitor-like YbhB/YbcL family protein
MDKDNNKLIVESPDFNQNGHIPLQYTCDGENINPPVNISNIPEGTKTLALILEDPDAPNGTFTHWLLWNIYPGDPITEKTSLGTSGINSFGKTGYGGPCPPSGTHRYYFKVYALDRELSIVAGEDKNSLLEAMEGHILATGELVGRYSRKTVNSTL